MTTTGPATEAAYVSRDRLVVMAVLGVPVIALSTTSALQFREWQWLCLTLAAPVAVWGAWPFHARAAAGLRHATVTVDTLVSLGVLASFGWSVYALFAGGAGMPGMRMPFTWTATPDDGTAHLYLEAVAGVPLFVSAGRFLAARATAGRLAKITGDAPLGEARANVFVPAALAVSVTALGFWLGAGAGTGPALTAAIAVLVVACPCALGPPVGATTRANLAWAFAYNLVMVPLAALGRLNPMLAAAAMALGTLVVAGNGLRLPRGGRR